ncbi:glycoside hydrolase family 18 protein [Providencia burhodogranariea]|uniref:chitinase n=1 Tax=Providencia burhodogranariea DSM 19968 TaxID=1141662 RepID=K8WI88_9GAMM|nr:glycoside hydrolase family 18 protein [Providencia burhodogranariea]EKT60288.1 Chitodextrinase [Providencia burhodogranariea DSM 19968]
MKKLTFVLIISCAILIQPAFADPNKRAISYLTSWGLPENAPKLIEDSKVDILLLSFGRWDEGGEIHMSDNMITPPTSTDLSWIPQAYLTWTKFKFDNPNKKVMVAFGGQNYEAIWSHLATPDSRERIAQNLVNLLNQNYPVFKKAEGQNQYRQVGTVQLDGIDFDFEKGARLTLDENANLLDLTKRVRQKMASLSGTKLLSLTTYHVGADPLECSNPTVVQNCSYIEPARSNHHGEVLQILKEGKNIFDFFNVMAYDAGPNFKYDVAMKNYARVIENPSKVVLGTTINSQWGPAGNFVESRTNNIERARWQARNNYGGFFVWALGSNNQAMPFVEQVKYINEMIDAANGASRSN